MYKNYLIVNTGSASKKYSFYSGEKKIYNAHFEIENKDLVVSENVNGKTLKRSIPKSEYTKAVGVVLASLIENKLISSKSEVHAAAVRIVAPGDYFLENKLINKEYLKKAAEALEKVPLHLGPALQEIENIRASFGNKISLYGISDSAFHATMPLHARSYAIPVRDSKKFRLYKYGYHGISIQSVTARAKRILGKLPEKTIVCHLGGGASVTAVLKGKSIDTSMGFTPLDGLVMATRVGEIDPGAVLYLSEKLKKNNKELETYFNNECGLLGLAGSLDLREVIEMSDPVKSNDHGASKNAAIALEIYVNRIKQYIGRMAAVLGGVDLIILAGTVGERSVIVREKICSDMNFLGIEIDKKANKKLVGVETRLDKKGSKTKLLVVKTDEMEEMAKSTYAFISKR